MKYPGSESRRGLCCVPSKNCVVGTVLVPGLLFPYIVLNYLAGECAVCMHVKVREE